MRGRTQAAVVALVGNWVPLMAPGAVALVTLRAGAASGFLVLVWALLPAALMISFSPADPVAVVFIISGLLITFLLALMLRVQASWSHRLMGAVAAGMLIALSLRLLAPDLAQAMAAALAGVVALFFDAARSTAGPPATSPA